MNDLRSATPTTQPTAAAAPGTPASVRPPPLSLPPMDVVAAAALSPPSIAPPPCPEGDDARGELVERAWFVVRLVENGATRHLLDRQLVSCRDLVLRQPEPLQGSLSLWGLMPHMLASRRFVDLPTFATRLGAALPRLARAQSAARVDLPRQKGLLMLVRTGDTLSVSLLGDGGPPLDRRVYLAEPFIAHTARAVERLQDALRALRAD